MPSENFATIRKAATGTWSWLSTCCRWIDALLNAPDRSYAVRSRILRCGVAEITRALKARGAGGARLWAGDTRERRDLGCGGERLYVLKLGQEHVLIVVAAARHDLPLFVEVADFAKRQRYPPAGGLERTKDPVVGAYGDKPCDDNVSRINVFGVHDSGIREGLGPCLGPFPELVPTIQIKTPRVIGVDEPLRRIADDACEITAVPIIVCSPERFHIF